jgi:hypothetical protein
MGIYSEKAVKNLRKMVAESGMDADKIALGAKVSGDNISKHISGKPVLSVHELEKVAVFLDKEFLDLFK